MKTFEQMRKGFLKEANDRIKELQAEVSKCDLELQDALHFLENEKCDAIAMVKTARKIKEIRMKRRSVKIELDKLHSTIASMTQGVVKFEKKTYTYKTKTMQEIHRTYRTK